MRRLAWRRVHIVINILVVILFFVQGISGPKDLLEIPLHWQQPAIYQCDFNARRCPQALEQVTNVQDFVKVNVKDKRNN